MKNFSWVSAETCFGFGRNQSLAYTGSFGRNWDRNLSFGRPLFLKVPNIDCSSRFALALWIVDDIYICSSTCIYTFHKQFTKSSRKTSSPFIKISNREKSRRILKSRAPYKKNGIDCKRMQSWKLRRLFYTVYILRRFFWARAISGLAVRIILFVLPIVRVTSQIDEVMAPVPDIKQKERDWEHD